MLLLLWNSMLATAHLSFFSFFLSPIKVFWMCYTKFLCLILVKKLEIKMSGKIQNRQQNTNSYSNCFNDHELLIVGEKKASYKMPSAPLASLEEQITQSRCWDCQKISHIVLNKKWTASSNCSNKSRHIGHWKPIKW